MDQMFYQQSQQWIDEYIPQESRIALEQKATHCYTALAGDRVIACGGVEPVWKNRAYAWTILADNIAQHFLELHFIIKRHLNNLPYRRFEAAVEVDHSNGHRWMRLLGFKRETPVPMEAYFPDGRPAILYSRIQR